MGHNRNARTKLCCVHSIDENRKRISCSILTIASCFSCLCSLYDLLLHSMITFSHCTGDYRRDQIKNEKKTPDICCISVEWENYFFVLQVRSFWPIFSWVFGFALERIRSSLHSLWNCERLNHILSSALCCSEALWLTKWTKRFKRSF